MWSYFTYYRGERKNGTNGRVLRPLWAHVLATCLFSRLFFFRMAEPGAWIWKREVSPMAYGERWCRLIHELMILNGLRWQIRAINLDMPACFAGGAFIRARITHWRLVRSNEGKKQKQMGRSRRRKPLFRKWISFISACGFVWIGSCAKKICHFRMLSKWPLQPRKPDCPSTVGVRVAFIRKHSASSRSRQIFQRFARQDRLGLSEPYLEICSLIEEKRLKCCLKPEYWPGVMIWKRHMALWTGFSQKVETKKRCQNEFVLTAKRLNFGPIMQEKVRLKKLQLQAEMQSK